MNRMAVPILALLIILVEISGCSCQGQWEKGNNQSVKSVLGLKKNVTSLSVKPSQIKIRLLSDDLSSATSEWHGLAKPLITSDGQKFLGYVSVSTQLNYYLSLPKSYERNSGKKWPLILFLHGSGEKGDSLTDLNAVLKNGLPKYVDNVSDFPFIVVYPQLPTKYSSWEELVDNGMMIEFLDEVEQLYNPDLNQIYATGLSLGGIGVYDLGLKHPTRFAAIAPVSGDSGEILAANDDQIKRMRSLRIWAFHGALDETVPENLDKKTVDRLRSAGLTVNYTVFPNLGHDCWDETYDNYDLYNWFLEPATSSLVSSVSYVSNTTHPVSTASELYNSTSKFAAETQQTRNPHTGGNLSYPIVILVIASLAAFPAIKSKIK